MKLQALETALLIRPLPTTGALPNDAPLHRDALSFQKLLEQPTSSPADVTSASVSRAISRRALDDASGAPGASGPLGPLGLLRRRLKEEASGLPPLPVRIVKPLETSQPLGPDTMRLPGVDRTAQRPLGLDLAEAKHATHTAPAAELDRHRQAGTLAAAILKVF